MLGEIGEAFDFKAQRGGEVLFVAQHHVDQRGEFAVDFKGACLAADGLPKRVAIVQIVGDDDAVAMRGFDGFFGNQRGGVGERGEDAAGVEPARAFGREDFVPVDLTGLELGDSGVAAVGAAQRGAHAEAALGEVEAIADGAADAVVLHPLQMRLVDAALVDEVFDEAANGVVGERGDDGGAQAKAALEAAGDVVFAAALPGLESVRVVWTRPMPGSRRSMTSPSETRSHLQDSLDLRVRLTENSLEICRGCYWFTPLARKPPSTARIWPATKEAASEAR